MKNKILILTLLAAIFLIATASATITITPTNVTSSSIMWQWSPITIQNLSIDGVFVCNVNPAATSFILSDLGPNEPHTIDIITAGDSGENTTSTSGDVNSDFLSTWGYLILILILCVVGMMRKLGIFLIVASAVSFYGLIVFINGNPITGTDPASQILFIIYLIFFIVPIWLCFGVKKGVFR